MKQRIGIAQLNELTDEQKERLREWWMPEQGDYFSDGKRRFVVGNTVRNGDIITYGEDMPHGKDGLSPLLSIGQMIELLEDRNGKLPDIQDYEGFALVSMFTDQHYEWTEELLADALWEAVKKVLK